MTPDHYLIGRQIHGSVTTTAISPTSGEMRGRQGTRKREGEGLEAMGGT